MSLPFPLNEHYEDPFHWGELEHATHEGEAIHEDCPDGRDVVLLQLHIDEDQITEAWFDGEGCEWCLAVASHFTERVNEMMVSEVAALTDVTCDELLAESIPASRHDCAHVVLHALKAALASADNADDGPHFSGPHLGEEQ